MGNKLSHQSGPSNYCSQDLEKVLEENRRLREENERLRRMLGLAPTSTPAYQVREPPALFSCPESLPQVDSKSPIKDKIHLFRILFRGREDVYAAQWLSERTGKKGYSPARVGTACTDNPIMRPN
jgi:hypothetical protein